MTKIVIAALVSLAALCAEAPGQQRGRGSGLALAAVVQVVAFEAGGRFLGAPDIAVFESHDHTSFAGRFHHGEANEIPFGEYRIEGRLPGYYPDVRYVGVYQPKTRVVLGLTFDHELPQRPPSLSGRVTGLPSPVGSSFVRLIGVYSSVSLESSIGDDGRFCLAGVPPGLFVLLVVGEDGVHASRTLRYPYTGSPLEIQAFSQAQDLIENPAPLGRR